MIEEDALVSAVEGGLVWIEKSRRPACSGCAESCGSSLTAQFFSEKKIRFPVVSALELKPGDRVVVGLAEDALVRGAFGVYLLPLFALLAGALIAKFLAESMGWPDHELAGALGGVSALLVSLMGLKVTGLFDRTGFQPVILRKIN